MTQHVSKYKLRFSEEPEGAESLSLSRRALQLAPGIFQVSLLMLFFHHLIHMFEIMFMQILRYVEVYIDL